MGPLQIMGVSSSTKKPIDIQKNVKKNPEAYFELGIAEKGLGNIVAAKDAFNKSKNLSIESEYLTKDNASFILAKKQLEANGYVVKSNFTKDVNILVNESGIESAKTKKAHDNNITVINDITTLIGG